MFVVATTCGHVMLHMPWPYYYKGIDHLIDQTEGKTAYGHDWGKQNATLGRSLVVATLCYWECTGGVGVAILQS